MVVFYPGISARTSYTTSVDANEVVLVRHAKKPAPEPSQGRTGA
jgi:hypothetical protein